MIPRQQARPALPSGCPQYNAFRGALRGIVTSFVTVETSEGRCVPVLRPRTPRNWFLVVYCLRSVTVTIVLLPGLQAWTVSGPVSMLSHHRQSLTGVPLFFPSSADGHGMCFQEFSCKLTCFLNIFGLLLDYCYSGIFRQYLEKLLPDNEI